MGSCETIKVAVLGSDSHARMTWERLIEESPGFVCVGGFTSAEAALAALPARLPDVVVVDLEPGDASGIKWIECLRTKLPKTEFAVLTRSENEEDILACIRAGARGYLLKTMPPEQVLQGLRELYETGAALSGPVARRILALLQRQQEPDPCAWRQLTSAQREVLWSLARGRLYKEVAAELGISAETVRKHAYNIYQRLQVHRRDDAVRKVFPKATGLQQGRLTSPKGEEGRNEPVAYSGA